MTQLSTPPEQKQRPLVSRPMHGTAFASIFSADANFMRDVAEMIHTEQWNSRAATSFRDNFLKPFETAADWQGAYVRELAVAAQTYRAFASPQLKLPPPGVNSDTYGQLDIKDADGKPPNQVVVSVVKLGRAGAYNLPGAAHEYDLALAKINACQIPSAMSRFFPRSIPPFNTACHQLATVLRQTRDDLNETGEAMLTAARTYRATDDEQAQILREISQIPPAPLHRTLPLTPQSSRRPSRC